MKVFDLMTDQVECVTPETSLESVAKLMAKDDVGSIPVCQDNKIVGLITDRDIVIRGIAKGHNPVNMKTKDYMSTDIVSVSPDTDVHEAARKMAQVQVKRLPVVSNGQLIGIVALGDLATEKMYVDEAGEALSGISQGIQH